VSLRRSVGLAGAVAALVAPASAAASVQQVLLPGPTPYPTQSPPLSIGAAPPAASLPFTIRARADERVLAGVGPAGEVVSLRVLHRLLLRGTGDYLLVIGAPVEDVRAAPGSDSQPGLRTGQILWSGFSPGQKILAADAELRPGEAREFLPLRLRVVREGDRYSLTVTNSTTVTESAYEGKGFRRQLAGVLDRTRRESLAGERLTTAYAPLDGLVRVRKNAPRIAAPLRVEGTLRFASAPRSARGGSIRGKTVSFSAVLGDASSLSLTVDVRGAQGAPRLQVVARPTNLVRALAPPRAASWTAAVRRRAIPADVLLQRLIDARMQLVRSDQYQAFLSNPDPQGTSRTTYVFKTAAALPPPTASPASDPGSGGANGLVFALAIAGSVLGLGAALVVWAHS
jgi:hypothetical protein